MSQIAMPEGASPSPADEKPKKKAHPTPWRDNVEAMLMAVVMALVLKYFVVEAYRIPTGSMQPTLMGNASTGIYDRILVDKWSYQVRDPKRWEVAVFRYPLDRSKNFVKRIVGVGPEEFRIAWGDLWHRQNADEAWQILRRPSNVQEETWLALAKQEPSSPLFFGTTGDKWQAERDVTLEGDFRMRFGATRASVMDGYWDGYPDSIKDDIPASRRGSNSHPVGDLRIDGKVTVDADVVEVEVELQEGAMRYHFILPGPAAPETDVARIAVRDKRVMIGDNLPIELDAKSEGLRLEAGRTYDFAAHNLDDLLELFVDGERLCSLEIDASASQAAKLYVETYGGQTKFEDLMVYRDIYYTADSALVSDTKIPAGHYFMMGDNTLDSSDSRMWQLHHFDRQTEDGSIERISGNHRMGNGAQSQSDFEADVNPFTSSMGTDDLRPITWFRDEWGELHTFEAGEASDKGLVPESAPFVPRHMMLGRAISVFWPLKPLDGIWRFKKVD